MITRAIIPAAGFGTRFLPASKAIPKELIPVVDKPTIQYVVEEAVEAGIREILIIISKGKEAICSHFESNPELETLLLKKGKHETLEAMKKLSHLARIQYAYQEEMKGLGDAILCARTFASSEPVAILLGDTILHAQGPVSPLQSMDWEDSRVNRAHARTCPRAHLAQARGKPGPAQARFWKCVNLEIQKFGIQKNQT